MSSTGPDLWRVEEEDGVSVRTESNYDTCGKHPAGGRVFVKTHGLVQKTYNPNRIKTPMKHANPKKGREHNTEFEVISWDEPSTLSPVNPTRSALRGCETVPVIEELQPVSAVVVRKYGVGAPSRPF